MRPPDRPGSITDEDRRQAERYIPHVQTLDPILRRALASLPDFEHDLIVMAYGFRPEGFSYRAEPDFDSYSPVELEDHLRQARVMFARKLQELLQKTEQTHAAQEILALLRGET